MKPDDTPSRLRMPPTPEQIQRLYARIEPENDVKADWLFTSLSMNPPRSKLVDLCHRCLSLPCQCSTLRALRRAKIKHVTWAVLAVASFLAMLWFLRVGTVAP